MTVSTLVTLLLGFAFDSWHCWAGDQTLPDIASCVVVGRRQQGRHQTLSRAGDPLLRAAVTDLLPTSCMSSPGEDWQPVVLMRYCMLLLQACMPQAVCAALERVR